MSESTKDWFKRQKKAAGTSNQKIADAIGINVSNISKIANGKVSLLKHHLKGFADELGVAPQEVLMRFGVLDEAGEAAGADTQPPASDTLSLDELAAILKAVREPLSKGLSTEADIQALATMIYEILIYHRDHPEETRTPDMLFAAAHALVSRLATQPGASTPDKPDRS